MREKLKAIAELAEEADIQLLAGGLKQVMDPLDEIEYTVEEAREDLAS